MAHGDSKKLQALKALTTLIEGITPGNGHDFDLAGKVYRGRGLFGADQEVPFVSLVEPDGSDPGALTGGVNKVVRVEWWRILAQGWAVDDPVNPTDVLYNLMAAVESRVSLILDRSSASFRLAGLLSDARIGPGYIPPQDPLVPVSLCFHLPIELQIAMNVSDPWNPTSNL